MPTGMRFITTVVLVTWIVFAGALVSAQTQQPPSPVRPPATPGGIPPKVPGQCCIAGEYEGHQKDTVPATKSCPKPEEGPFKMVIYQQEKCGAKIWGKVTGKDGSVQEFSGTVSPGPKGCCNIQGTMKKPGEETMFKGTLCPSGGKWAGNGDYTHKRLREGVLCTGTWKMKQM